MVSLSNRLLANKRFEFVSTAYDAGKFSVVNMQGYEALSRPFRFTLTLVSDDANVDFDKMLRHLATFVIYSPSGGEGIPYYGVLAELEQLHRADGYVFYRAVLVPRLWRLSMYRISEVYLNEQTIPGIIETVLKDGLLPSSAFELKLSGDYRQRSFVCQYQEPHLDFLSRWMEKEGMYYWFDHGDKQDKLVIGDSKMMHAPDAIKVAYRPADELDTGTAPDAVQGFVCRQKPLPYQVILQEFNHRKANVELWVEQVVSEDGVGDVMIYGENFRNEAEGRRYAKLRAEEIACGGKVFSGDATAVGLRSGCFMELSHHYREGFNGKYLVTEVHHEGSQAGALLEGIRSPYNREGTTAETSYRNSFTAIPADVQFRPERVTPKPRVAGTMNATIDGEGSGDYAELDEFGQYKVQLPFDLSDKKANKGSARVRMATPYSGSNHGMHFPLHKNAEVLLSFIDGDPDQPVILGAVPNSENVSLVNAGSATENRISTKAGNQLHMSDVKGKEVIWLNSPFHHSSIGIGSVDPKGGGSIYAATKGSSDSVSFGNSNSMSFGSKNSLSAGTASSLDLSIANKVSIGASIAIGLSNDIKWNMNLVPLDMASGLISKLKDATFKSFTIDDSSSAKFASESTNEAALETYSIAAGHADLDPLVLKAKVAKRVFRGVIGGYTLLNLAASTVFSMGVNGQLKNVDDATATDKRRAASKTDRDARKKAELDALDADFASGSPVNAAGAAIVDRSFSNLTLVDQAARSQALNEIISGAEYNDPEVMASQKDARTNELAAVDTTYAGTDADSTRIRDQKRAEVMAKFRKQRDVARLAAIKAINDQYDKKLTPMQQALKADELAAAKRKATDDVNARYTEEENVDKSGMKDNSFVGGWPGVITKFGVDAISNVATMAVVQGAARTVTGQIKDATKSLISKINLDKTGIKATVDFALPPLGAGGNNALTMDARGVVVEAKSLAGTQSKLDMGPGGTTTLSVTGGQKLALSSSEASLEFAGSSTKVLLNATGGTMKTGANELAVTAADASMKVGSSKTSVSAAGAKMEVGANNLSVSPTGVSLAAGSNKAAVDPSGFSVNGVMIRLA